LLGVRNDKYNLYYCFLDTYTIPNPVCNHDKALEYKSSCRIYWKDSIKYRLFLKWNVCRTATKLGRAPYETEWDFFIKSLLNGKTDALIHLLLLIIIVTFGLIIIFFHRNKKK
jgi:hypothetical protein